MIFAAIALVFSVVGAIIVGLLKDEVRDWIPKLSERIQEKAAVRTGPDLYERYKEEWASDAAAYPGRLSKLYFAVSCYFAAGRITPKELKFSFAQITKKIPYSVKFSTRPDAIRLATILFFILVTLYGLIIMVGITNLIFTVLGSLFVLPSVYIIYRSRE